MSHHTGINHPIKFYILVHGFQNFNRIKYFIFSKFSLRYDYADYSNITCSLIAASPADPGGKQLNSDNQTSLLFLQTTYIGGPQWLHL